MFIATLVLTGIFTFAGSNKKAFASPAPDITSFYINGYSDEILYSNDKQYWPSQYAPYIGVKGLTVYIVSTQM